jgi:hypothetical protein
MTTHAIAISELLPPLIRATKLRPSWFDGLLLALMPSVGGPMVAAHFNRISHEFARQSVWYRGLRAQLADRTDDAMVDEHQSILTLLDQSASNLQSARKVLLSIRSDYSNMRELPTWFRPGPELGRAVELMLRTSAELFEEVQAFKTALLEHDADRAPRLEGRTATSPEELKKLFSRL